MYKRTRLEQQSLTILRENQMFNKYTNSLNMQSMTLSEDAKKGGGFVNKVKNLIKRLISWIKSKVKPFLIKITEKLLPMQKAIKKIVASRRVNKLPVYVNITAINEMLKFNVARDSKDPDKVSEFREHSTSINGYKSRSNGRPMGQTKIQKLEPKDTKKVIGDILSKVVEVEKELNKAKMALSKTEHQLVRLETEDNPNQAEVTKQQEVITNINKHISNISSIIVGLNNSVGELVNAPTTSDDVTVAPNKTRDGVDMESNEFKSETTKYAKGLIARFKDEYFDPIQSQFIKVINSNNVPNSMMVISNIEGLLAASGSGGPLFKGSLHDKFEVNRSVDLDKLALELIKGKEPIFKMGIDTKISISFNDLEKSDKFKVHAYVLKNLKDLKGALEKLTKLKQDKSKVEEVKEKRNTEIRDKNKEMLDDIDKGFEELFKDEQPSSDNEKKVENPDNELGRKNGNLIKWNELTKPYISYTGLESIEISKITKNIADKIKAEHARIGNIDSVGLTRLINNTIRNEVNQLELGSNSKVIVTDISDGGTIDYEVDLSKPHDSEIRDHLNRVLTSNITNELLSNSSFGVDKLKTTDGSKDESMIEFINNGPPKEIKLDLNDDFWNKYRNLVLEAINNGDIVNNSELSAVINHESKKVTIEEVTDYVNVALLVNPDGKTFQINLNDVLRTKGGLRNLFNTLIQQYVSRNLISDPTINQSMDRRRESARNDQKIENLINKSIEFVKQNEAYIFSELRRDPANKGKPIDRNMTKDAIVKYVKRSLNDSDTPLGSEVNSLELNEKQVDRIANNIGVQSSLEIFRIFKGRDPLTQQKLSKEVDEMVIEVSKINPNDYVKDYVDMVINSPRPMNDIDFSVYVLSDYNRKNNDVFINSDGKMAFPIATGNTNNPILKEFLSKVLPRIVNNPRVNIETSNSIVEQAKGPNNTKKIDRLLDKEVESIRMIRRSSERIKAANRKSVIENVTLDYINEVLKIDSPSREVLNGITDIVEDRFKIRGINMDLEAIKSNMTLRSFLRNVKLDVDPTDYVEQFKSDTSEDHKDTLNSIRGEVARQLNNHLERSGLRPSGDDDLQAIRMQINIRSKRILRRLTKMDGNINESTSIHDEYESTIREIKFNLSESFKDRYDLTQLPIGDLMEKTQSIIFESYNGVITPHTKELILSDSHTIARDIKEGKYFQGNNPNKFNKKELLALEDAVVTEVTDKILTENTVNKFNMTAVLNESKRQVNELINNNIKYPKELTESNTINRITDKVTATIMSM